MPTNDANRAHAHRRDDFATTQWTLVLAAGGVSQCGSREALAQLCETYWYPVYAYVRRRMADVHEAQDFTQAFFAHLLEHGIVADADPDRGRFRAFLLTACKRFLINEWQKARAAKRGGGRRPLSLDFESGESRYSLVAVDPRTAEQLYDQQWAITLLERVLQQLRAEYAAKDRLAYFDALKPYLAGASKQSGYGEAARALGISEATAKVAAHRLRQRYREMLRSAIGQTVEHPGEIDDEIRGLFAVLGSEKGDFR